MTPTWVVTFEASNFACFVVYAHVAPHNPYHSARRKIFFVEELVRQALGLNLSGLGPQSMSLCPGSQGVTLWLPAS